MTFIRPQRLRLPLVLGTRVDATSNMAEQYVWETDYVDGLIRRDRIPDTGGGSSSGSMNNGMMNMSGSEEGKAEAHYAKQPAAKFPRGPEHSRGIRPEPGHIFALGLRHRITRGRR